MRSQVYCSALPVSYNRIQRRQNWARFAGLILDAAYEATLLVAVLNRRKYGPRPVYLTSLGGGAFGNDAGWISAAMRRALHATQSAGLDVRIISNSTPSQDMRELADEMSNGCK